VCPLPVALILTIACGGGSEGDLSPPPETLSPLRLEVSSADAAPGDQIAMVVRLVDASQGSLLGVQGVVSYDSAHLRYLGQASGPEQLLVNDRNPGVLRVIALAAAGLPPEAFTLVLEVVAPGYLDRLGFELEAAALDGAGIPPGPLGDPVVRPDLSVPAVENATAGDSLGRISNGHAASPPGTLAAVRYGDITVDGSIDVTDAYAISRAAVGLETLGELSGQDQLGLGNVRPVNGGPGATGVPPGCDAVTTCRPGVEPRSSRAPLGNVDVVDAVAVLRHAAGHPDPVVGLLPNIGPSTPTEGLQFYGDFESPEPYRGWDISQGGSHPWSLQTVTSPARGAAQAARIELRRTDSVVAGNKRSQIQVQATGFGNGALTVPAGKTISGGIGDEAWFGFSVYIPGDWVFEPAYAPETIWEVISGVRSPFLEIQISGSQWQVINRTGHGPQNDPSWVQQTTNTPITRGAWTDWVIHYVLSGTTGGTLQVWKNGTMIVNKTGTWTCFTDVGTYTKPSWGIYKWSWNAADSRGNAIVSNRVLYLDAVRVTDGGHGSYQAVKPR
jgi:hypothetical protein